MQSLPVITLNPRLILRILSGVAILLIILSLAGQYMRYFTVHNHLLGLIGLFDLDQENNIPTFFSAMLYLLSSGLIFLAGFPLIQKRATQWLRWLCLSSLFLIMAMDEAASIHELFIIPMQKLLGDYAAGPLFFAWVVPALVFVIVIGVFLFPLILNLPGPTKRWFTVSIIVFLAGALGVEMLGSSYDQLAQPRDFNYSLFTTLEESLEIFGGIGFIGAFLNYLEKQVPKWTIHFESRN